jgi:site-specific recombinase XerD
MNSELAYELSQLVKDMQLSGSDLLFNNTTGQPMHHSNFRKRNFLIVVSEADVSPIRFHDLRHTALTLMVDSGINLKVVQSIAGHEDIQTTMKYVHLLGNSIEQVAQSFKLG